MKTKSKVIILIAIIVLTIIYSVNVAGAETFKQNTQIDFIKTCTNSSDNICSSTAGCNLSIRSPSNNSFIIKNKVMSNNETGIFNYTLTSSLTNAPGKYQWDMFCCDGLDCGEAHGEYQITATGGELTQDRAMIYLGMLALLILIFFLTIFGIGFLPSKNNSSEDGMILDINNLKYLRAVFWVFAWGLLMGIMFVASNVSFLYLEAAMMGNIFFAFFRVMMIFSAPFIIVWFLFIFYNIFQDKEVKRMLERGIPMEEGKGLF